MYVASAKILLEFHNNDSLAVKKREMEALLKDVHRKFNASATEVDEFEDLERCVIGVSLTAGTERGASAALKKLLDHIDSTAFARVVMEDTQLFAFD